MPEWLNEPGEWAAIVSIFSAVMAALLWIIRREILTQRKEFRPNGVTSLRDVVNRISARQSEDIRYLERLRHDLADHNDKASAAHAKIHERVDDHVLNYHRDK